MSLHCSKVLYAVLGLILAAEFQLTSCQEGVTSQHDNSSLPVAYPATVLEGGGQVCPPEEQREMARAEIAQDVLNTVRNNILDVHCPGQVQENPASSCLEVSQCDPQLPSEYYWITSSNGAAVQVYCDMTRECSCSSASVGGWSRVAYLNMTDPTHQCPPAWREFTEPVRTCGRTNETVQRASGGSLGGCSAVSFSTYNSSYSHICGKIIGYQLGNPEAFLAYSVSWHTRIEDPYVDGVVITRGTEIEHVWTFAASRQESDTHNSICPCTDDQSTQSIPSFVGQDYFCETGITSGWSTGVFYPDGDPLWDGEDCGSGSTCCELHDPPYFCKSLTEPVTGDIEVRICGDELINREDTPIQLLEIFVQ